MKILIINTHDISGGAAWALLESDMESRMLVQSKKSDDETVIGRKSMTMAQKVVDIFRSQFETLPKRFYKYKTKTLFSPAWLPLSSVIRGIEAFDPDKITTNSNITPAKYRYQQEEKTLAEHGFA